MAATTEHGERLNRVENRVDVLTEDVNQLKGAYEHLATKADLKDLESRLTWRMFLAIAAAQSIGVGIILYFLP